MGLFNKKKTQQNKKKWFVNGAFALGGAVISAAIILPALLVKCKANPHAGGWVDYDNLQKSLKPWSAGPSENQNHFKNPSAFTYGWKCKVPVNLSTPGGTHPTGYDEDGTTPDPDGDWWNEGIGNGEYITTIADGLTQNDVYNMILIDGIEELVFESLDDEFGQLIVSAGLTPQMRITSINWTEESPEGSTLTGTYKALNYTVEWRLYGEADIVKWMTLLKLPIDYQRLDQAKAAKICDGNYRLKNLTQVINTVRPLFLFGCNTQEENNKKEDCIDFAFGNFSWKNNFAAQDSLGEEPPPHINSITSKMRTDSMKKGEYVTNIAAYFTGSADPENVAAIEADWVNLSIPLEDNPFPNFEFSEYRNTRGTGNYNTYDASWGYQFENY